MNYFYVLCALRVLLFGIVMWDRMRFLVAMFSIFRHESLKGASLL